MMKTIEEQRKETTLSMESAKKIREVLKTRGFEEVLLESIVVVHMSEEISHG